MNRTEFKNALSKELSYSDAKCNIILDTIEEHFFLNSKNQDKIINELKDNLQIDYEEASRIYNTALKIFKTEIKNKIKHPFKTNHI